MGFEIRTITEADIEQYLDVLGIAFGADRNDGEADRLRQVLGLDRASAVFDRGRIVATMGSYRLDVVVPGGADVAAAGLTRVTVAATHRRQGLLTAMIDAHLSEAEADRRPISVLWASEAPIYGRFGYGSASENVAIDIDAGTAGIVAPRERDELSIVSAEEAAPVLADVYDRARTRRPGFLKRNDAWWEQRILSDRDHDREGNSSLRRVVARRDGDPVGYVLYRQKPQWDDHDLPQGTNHLVELVALDHRAEHNLWWYLSSIDLFPNVKIWTEPSDTILPRIARNERAVVRRTNDGIHVRIVDVATALEARRYDAAGNLAIAVTGPSAADAGAGTFRLIVDDDGWATCRPTEDEADVSISVTGLGSLYLGAGSIPGLLLRGELTGAPDHVDQLRRCFAWPVAPWCNDLF